MSTTEFIPCGRTSLVNRNGTSLQIQTEYAYRPYPRVTTTILDGGRVLHKVEKKLEKCVDSPEDQAAMEEIIKHQHSQVMLLIKDQKPKKVASTQTQRIRVLTEPTFKSELKEIAGVEKVFFLDKGGAFENDEDAFNFKRYFPSLFKGLTDLIEMFMRLPGAEVRREIGVVEIKKDRLYFISSGFSFAFAITVKKEEQTNFEKTFKDLIDPSPLR